MGVKITDPGALLTIQDGGRQGYQRYGIAESGACDRESLTLGNLLVGNQPNTPVLEATLIGPVLEFTSDMLIALTGADMEPRINGRTVDNYCAIRVWAGDVLTFGGLKNGLRTYISFEGGLRGDNDLKSASTDLRAGLGGISGRALRAGDMIETGNSMSQEISSSPRQIDPPTEYTGSYEIRVVLGPEDEKFTKEALKRFFEDEYTVSDEYDRMGIRLRGPFIEHIGKADIISNGIPKGAIQVADNGQPIIMLADRQTVGGYTKLGCVASVDLPLIAQARAGDRIRFKEINVYDAQKLIAERSRRWKAIAKDISSGDTAHKQNLACRYRVLIDGREFDVEVSKV